jgi:hypothetical protein
MKRLITAALLAGVPLVPMFDVPRSAFAQSGDVAAKEAFEAARALGTVAAWEAFLTNFPTGFYADLARAYMQNLRAGGAAPAAPAQSATPRPAAPQPAPAQSATPQPAPAPRPAPSVAAPVAPAAPPAVAAPPVATAAAGSANATELPPTNPAQPAVARGGNYMGFAERFNRYYTDPSWKAARTLFVSPNGNGNGASREAPMSVRAALDGVQPGTRINFLRGNYQACFELDKGKSGTYDAPVVLYGERNEDRSLGVKINCCTSGVRQACFNLEGADYVALDGFEMIGGRYGVRAIGAGYAASQHARGLAVIDSNGHDQERDPFFTGQVDWAVFERNVAYGAKKGDGHGYYLSNGGDWNIVRFNETWGNLSSDFQINADPASTCKEENIPFNDPRCDAYAGTGEGGRGASDYFLVDGNYFHHGLASGANFTSVRRSVIRNNIFGTQVRHNVSFWQETDNPKLGSSENKILHNLFITTGRHGVKFENSSTRNEFVNNVLIGIQVNGTTVTANPGALLMEVDGTVGENVYRSNLYVSGKLEGRSPGSDEVAIPNFSPAWFAKFPAALNHDPADYRPMPGSPMIGRGTLSPAAAADRAGVPRSGQVDLGPIEVP